MSVGHVTLVLRDFIYSGFRGFFYNILQNSRTSNFWIGPHNSRWHHHVMSLWLFGTPKLQDFIESHTRAHQNTWTSNFRTRVPCSFETSELQASKVFVDEHQPTPKVSPINGWSILFLDLKILEKTPLRTNHKHISSNIELSNHLGNPMVYLLPNDILCRCTTWL